VERDPASIGSDNVAARPDIETMQLCMVPVGEAKPLWRSIPRGGLSRAQHEDIAIMAAVIGPWGREKVIKEHQKRCEDNMNQNAP